MASEDTSNFFQRTDYNEDYWTNYLAARPHYDEPFYQSIYDYHHSHGGRTETAHDIATGPGQVAAELSSHFDHIIASDINETHLDVAAHRLSPLISSQKVTLLHSSAEAIADAHPPSSADFITAAECLPLMNAASAIGAFTKLLKPNGTLAIWFYGRPFFAEPDYAGKCQPLLESILDLAFSKIIRKSGPQAEAGWKSATDRMASFLDDVELKSDVWQDVQRWKWNADHPMPFYGPKSCDFDVEPSSAVAVGETIVEKQNAGFWARSWDLDGVRRFVTANLPGFDLQERDERVEGWYEELGQAMGGESAVRKISWPVVLILASKR